MTKKDYVALAQAINRSRPDENGEYHNADVYATIALTIGIVADNIATVCANDNAAFDRARFLTACGC